MAFFTSEPQEETHLGLQWRHCFEATEEPVKVGLAGAWPRRACLPSSALFVCEFRLLLSLQFIAEVTDHVSITRCGTVPESMPFPLGLLQ